MGLAGRIRPARHKINYEKVVVTVNVTLSPTADTVAVGESSDTNGIEPPDAALNTAAFPNVTARLSLAFAVNVFVSVAVDAPPVCA